MKITELDKDDATFLPALGINIQNVSRPLSSLRPTPPKNINSVEQYSLLNPDQSLWPYPKILYSAGHAEFDTNTGKERALHQRDKSKTFVLWLWI